VPELATRPHHAKKKTKRAQEQHREDVEAARQQFTEDLKSLRAEDLIAVDEMGCVTGMSRAYGYARCGERAVSYEPAGKGTRLTVIGALSVQGFLGGLEVTGSVNGDVFEAFLEQIVVPHLGPGKVVLLDNVPFHHRESIQERIEECGATVKFLPPYSPEFNPIEECWSKLKTWLRKRSARTVPALQDALTEAIQHVTSSDAEGWFRHAGYQFNGNE
jgi:transposase